MIREHCFSAEWLDRFKKQAQHRKIDKIILEKMIYALHLLEQLSFNGLEFVFKGGTSLVLLLEEGKRFSIDIDIICNVDRDQLEEILDKTIESSRFMKYELDEHRSYKEGVPKAHYGFEFESVVKTAYSGKILLDILVEDSIYHEHTHKRVDTKWIEVDDPQIVRLPTIESITGDKLTAFAPNTIGIPYFKGRQSFAMEIIKQLFDLNSLFDKLTGFPAVEKSFYAFAVQEIKFRKKEMGDLTPEQVLYDILNTCIVITKRGKGSDDEKEKFNELQNGIKAFGTGFLMSGNFRIDEAVIASSKVAYMVSKLLMGNDSPLIKYEGQSVEELLIEDQNWNFLNRLKKHPDKAAFFYWNRAVQLLIDK